MIRKTAFQHSLQSPFFGCFRRYPAPGDGAIDWAVFLETLDVIGFNGHIGLDIGGPESEIEYLDAAYVQAARWLESNWKECS